jgi:hypothetical protein
VPSIIVDNHRKRLHQRFGAMIGTACKWLASRGALAYTRMSSVGMRIFNRGLTRIAEAEFTFEKAPEETDHIASALSLSDDKKADIIVSLLGICHDSLAAWTTRAHEAITWAVGITFAVVSFVFVSPEKVSLSAAIVISIGLLLFGIMIQLYVRSARRAYSGNRLAIVKCEAALRLYEQRVYLDPQAFFVYSKAMQTSQTLRVLSLIHIGTTFVAIVFVIGRVIIK